MNVIAQAKAVNVNGPQGPTQALMIAVNINDSGTAEAFVTQVAEKFKLERMVSMPNTTMLLITLIGGLSAPVFAERWREVRQNDPIIDHFMSLMVVADVIQATQEGRQVSKASLL